MLTNNNKLLILGIPCLVLMIGCKSSQHHDSSWIDSPATSAAYASALPTPSYTPLVVRDEWSCPMHPRFRQPEPGKCSICGMDLVRSGSPSSANSPANASEYSHSSDTSHSGHSGSSGHGGGCCGG
jgi:hypothetical protein